MLRHLRSVTRFEPPKTGPLAILADGPGAYVDAFRLDIAPATDLTRYLGAFFTTPVFRAERAILSFAGFPSGEGDVEALATGATETFAVWEVAERSTTDLLLRDVTGRTRSWFGVEAKAAGTRLGFGSAILPARDGPGRAMPTRLILDPHRAYSRVLLASAASRLDRA